MPLDWLQLGQSLVQLGFAGLSAYLLYERRLHAREDADRQKQVLEVVRDNTVAMQRNSDAVSSLERTVASLTQEVRIESVGRRRRGA